VLICRRFCIEIHLIHGAPAPFGSEDLEGVVIFVDNVGLKKVG
jgi:hypothetical protein